LQGIVFRCFSFCLIHLHVGTDFAVEIGENKTVSVQFAENLWTVLYRFSFSEFKIAPGNVYYSFRPATRMYQRLSTISFCWFHTVVCDVLRTVLHTSLIICRPQQIVWMWVMSNDPTIFFDMSPEIIKHYIVIIPNIV
jgi:hypothetical protein